MRQVLAALLAAGLLAGAAGCSDDDGSQSGDAPTSSNGTAPPITTSTAPATTTGAPTTAASTSPEVCDTFPEWLGPSTSAVVRRTEGSASCEEVAAVAREFYFSPGVPATGTAQGWECSRDPVGVDHVGDCVGPNGRLAVDVSRPGDA